MSTPLTDEYREKHSKRRQRNLHAKRLRQDREYLPKIVEEKKKKKSRRRMSPRDIERYMHDDEDPSYLTGDY